MTTTTSLADAKLGTRRKSETARKIVSTTLSVAAAVGAVFGVYMLYKSMTASACVYDSRYPAWAAKAFCDGMNGG